MKEFFLKPKQVYRNLSDVIFQRKKLSKLKKIYNEFIINREFFIPRIVHIETRTRCSGRCSFCLASVLTDPRDDEYMSMNYIFFIFDKLTKVLNLVDRNI